MGGKSFLGRLHRLIVAYCALGILATGTVIAVVSIVPLYQHLKQDEHKNLLIAARSKAVAVEDYIGQTKATAWQIARETQLRENLEAYNRQKLSLNALQNLSTAKLREALKTYPDVAGISRLDRSGKQVVSVGLAIPAEFWPVPVAGSQTVKVHAPVILSGTAYLAVGVPILNDLSQRAGTDIVLFKLDPLQQQILSKNRSVGEAGQTVLGSLHSDGVEVFFPLINPKNTDSFPQIAEANFKNNIVGIWNCWLIPTCPDMQNPKNLFIQERSSLIFPKTSAVAQALEKAVHQDTGLFISHLAKEPQVIAYSPIQGSDWGLAVIMPSAQLYAPANRQIVSLGSTLFLLILAGTTGTILCLRPLANATILPAGDLERLVRQTTLSLPANSHSTLTQAALPSGQRYRFTDAGGAEAVWEWNLETNELDFSPQWKALLGYDKSEIGTHPDEWFKRVHPDDMERVKAEITVHLAGLTTYFHNEHRILHQDGNYRWVRTQGMVIRNAAGKAFAIAGALSDMTERKTLEEENLRLAAFPRYDPNPVLASDREGNLIYLNPAARRVIDKLNLDEPASFLPANHRQLVRSCLDTNQSERHIEVKVKERIYSWSYHPLAHLNVVHLYALDITERQWAEEQLLQAAWHDELTGLPNRTLFIHRLEQAVARAKQSQDGLFAVLFLDLDRFKVVNDSLGHMLGDQFLIVIARRLEACLRRGDVVARMGGDEFTILLATIRDVNDATSFAERIQQQLMLPVNLNEHDVFTTASIGIAIGSYHQKPELEGVNGRPYEQPEYFLRDADLAMYRAKALGKARYVVFDSAMHKHALALLQLENDLRRAVQSEKLQVKSEEKEIPISSFLCEFLLHYQPIVALDTGRIAGFEALVRWQHPERGLISPAEFIPVAEETGLIVPLGAWVLLEACRQLHHWQERFPFARDLTMTVNLSGKQLSQPHLLAQIDEILQQTGINPLCLKLEITESVLMENAAAATEVLEQLRNRNIGLCIDDFGTGYSSLSYLHRFPINTLKIDRSFVSEMAGDDENSEIVRAIVTLAHNLGMYVVAEGVETEKQLVQLWAQQCEYGQGYFFSKPLPSEAAEALMVSEPQW